MQSNLSTGTLLTFKIEVALIKSFIFADFDCNMNKKLILEIIKEMEDNGFKIYGIIFDCGNKTLIKELEIESGGKYFFPNPCDPTRNVYFFPGTFLYLV